VRIRGQSNGPCLVRSRAWQGKSWPQQPVRARKDEDAEQSGLQLVSWPDQPAGSKQFPTSRNNSHHHPRTRVTGHVPLPAILRAKVHFARCVVGQRQVLVRTLMDNLPLTEGRQGRFNLWGLNCKETHRAASHVAGSWPSPVSKGAPILPGQPMYVQQLPNLTAYLLPA
jgi:hypothetical protein